MTDPIFILAASDPLDHVLNKWIFGPALSMHMVTMFVAAGLLVWVLLAAAKSIATGDESEGVARFLPGKPLAHVIEVITVYLLDNVIRPQLGPDAKKFAPFLLTIFFFILVNNLLGLVPLMDIQHLIGMHKPIIGGTATGNIAVTGALALIAFVLIQVNGLRSCGPVGWAKHFLGGAPWYLAPIMIPVEIMGTFIKPFALAIRLFANMTAGHVLLAVLMGFTLSLSKSPLIGVPVTLISVVASVAIMFLELFVAFLQSFIFMFLTTLFIAQLSHHDHDDHAGAEAYDEQHPMEGDKAAPVSQF